MIKGSVAYVLCRIEDDSSLTPVSQHDARLAETRFDDWISQAGV